MTLRVENSPRMIETVLSGQHCGDKFTHEAMPAKLFQFNFGMFIKGHFISLAFIFRYNC